MHTSPDTLALRALGEDIGTPDERTHLEHCPLCTQELAELARVAAIGRTATASDAIDRPSPEVWDRIRAELGFAETVSAPVATAAVASETARTDSPAPPGEVRDISAARSAGARTGGASSPRLSSTARRLISLAVAAALALIVGVGVGIGYERQSERPFDRVIARATLTASSRWPGATGTAEVTADGRGGRNLVLRMNTPEPVDGTRTVWLMSTRAEGPTLMGTMKSGEAVINIPKGMSLFETPLVDVSDEPADDPQPEVRTGETIVHGQLE